MRRPTLGLAEALNRAVRQDDEWWDEPDELERVERALARIDDVDDPVRAAGVVAYRIARAQASVKATSALPAAGALGAGSKWLDGRVLLPPNDWTLADLLVKAASGLDLEADVVDLIIARR